MGANAAPDETPGHGAKPLGVEIPQVDDVHGGKLARIALSFCALAALTMRCCAIPLEGG